MTIRQHFFRSLLRAHWPLAAPRRELCDWHGDEPPYFCRRYPALRREHRELLPSHAGRGHLCGLRRSAAAGGAMTADTQDEEADAEERKRSRLGNRRLRELLVDDADDRGSGRAKIEPDILYHSNP
jgi:hypothetical protein